MGGSFGDLETELPDFLIREEKICKEVLCKSIILAFRVLKEDDCVNSSQFGLCSTYKLS